MNFDFSDEQKFLRDEVRKFLSSASATPKVREVLDDDSKSYHKELWTQIIEMGWLGTAIPEEFGGQGMNMLDLCVIAEEVGRAISPVPFSSTVYFFAEAIKLAGTNEQKATYLPKISSGELIGCYASSEGPGHVNPTKLSCKVSNSKIRGTKVPVTDGDVATHAVVLGADEKGAGWFIVDLNSQGVSRDKVETIEPTRSHAELKFDGATAERLGGVGEGQTLHETLLNKVAVLLAFEQLGGASVCLERATEYAKERFAFGRPIGGNQAIKHKLADVYVKNEIARSNCYYGAWALSSNASELPEAAAASRLAASEAFWFASKENIQTHGGMGFTWEVDCHLYYRRAKMLAVQAGSPSVWKEKLVKTLELKNTV